MEWGYTLISSMWQMLTEFGINNLKERDHFEMVAKQLRNCDSWYLF